jgi:hypothetical protein
MVLISRFSSLPGKSVSVSRQDKQFAHQIWLLKPTLNPQSNLSEWPISLGKPAGFGGIQNKAHQSLRSGPG